MDKSFQYDTLYVSRAEKDIHYFVKSEDMQVYSYCVCRSCRQTKEGANAIGWTLDRFQLEINNNYLILKETKPRHKEYVHGM